jgi:[ribosomal protein S5]-alanine N-acetyltransferase
MPEYPFALPGRKGRTSRVVPAAAADRRSAARYRARMDGRTPTLAGVGVVLRAVRADDVAGTLAITFYDGRPARDEADAAAMLARIHDDVARGDSVHWGICVGGSDRVVGTVGFYRGFSDATGEIGYVLSEAHRGRGIMTRAVVTVVAYGLGPLGLRRIVAKTAPDNLASRAVLCRAGFRLVDAAATGLLFAVSAADALDHASGIRSGAAFDDVA